MNGSEFNEAILSGDATRRNAALKMLYKSQIVQGTLRQWAGQFNLFKMEPEDILQEGIILLDNLVREGRFRGASKPETFLLGICYNIIRDHKKKVDRVELKESFSDADLYRPETLADALELKELSAEEADRDDRLRAAMAELTEKCREALRLYYLEQKSMAQVAVERGLANANQAKKAVDRCRQSLRDAAG
jgi:RNA polymerase sigma factor (sigma-70 family)